MRKPVDLGAGRSVVASPAAFACPAARPSPASAVAPPSQPRCILIDAQKADYPIAFICRPRSVPWGRATVGLCAWTHRAETATRAPQSPCRSDQAAFEARGGPRADGDHHMLGRAG
jgi:hypothetical protein